MASVSPESLAQAAESCRGSFCCCHVAPQNPVELPIHPYCFCLSFFSVLMFFGCFLLIKLLCLCLLFSLPHGPKSCLPKAALFISPLALVLSQLPAISAACLSAEQKIPQSANGPKTSYLSFDGLLWLSQRVLHFLICCTSLLRFFLIFF